MEQFALASHRDFGLGVGVKESGFWPGVGFFLLRDTLGMYNESYNENFACTLLWTFY